MKAMDSKIPPLIYGMKEVHGLERTVVPKAGSSNITKERHTKIWRAQTAYSEGCKKEIESKRNILPKSSKGDRRK